MSDMQWLRLGWMSSIIWLMACETQVNSSVEKTTTESTDTAEADTGDTESDSDADTETEVQEDPSSGECSDGLDNDEDGVVDCEDTDCEEADNCRDDDADGTPNDQDCNPYNPYVHPDAEEVPNNGLDDNCDGVIDEGSAPVDQDNDGWDETEDCNDSDPSIHPSAYDVSGDGIDQDCDGYDGSSSTQDADFDGYYSYEDCDDSDPYTFPGAAYLDSYMDCMTDADYDGYGDSTPSNSAVSPGSDCDDQDYMVNPMASDIPDDGIDQDCDGADTTTTDADSDGYTANEDCDDTDPSIYPNATDIPDDGIDQDCDGVDSTATDGDLDGYDLNHDCDDADAAINPGAAEIPNDGIDQDCDGLDLTGSCPLDAATTNTGAAVFSTTAAPVNNQVLGSCNYYDAEEYLVEWTPLATGCATIDTFGTQQDTVLSVYSECPGYGGAIELECNDEALNQTGFYGESELQIDVTSNQAVYIAVEGWFQALSGATLNISLDQTQDCSGLPLDQDGDGYDPSLDCDDTDPTIHPGAVEIPADGVDQDCDTLEYCFIDVDNDSFGSPEDTDGDGAIDTIPSVDLICDGLLEADNTLDCDDFDALVYPSAPDTAGDGVDSDCDGLD